MKLPRLALLWLLLGWVFVVLYPNPALLVRSIDNIRHVNVDPAAVQGLARTLPDDPRLIEQAVLTRLVPYAYDWQVNGVPWYFPSTAEVLAAKRGDCESRAVLLASILQAKGIPYQLLMSFDHIWVQYPGKPANALENPDVLLVQWVNGRLVWHWPKDFHLGAEINAQLAMYWTPMPGLRKALLFCGLLLLLLINPVAAIRWRRLGSDERRRPLVPPAPALVSRPALRRRADVERVERGDWRSGMKPKPDKFPPLFRLVSVFVRPGAFDTFAPDELLEDGRSLSDFGLDATVLHLPGHTRGSIGILTRNGALFRGDLMDSMMGKLR